MQHAELCIELLIAVTGDRDIVMLTLDEPQADISSASKSSEVSFEPLAAEPASPRHSVV